MAHEKERTRSRSRDGKRAKRSRSRDKAGDKERKRDKDRDTDKMRPESKQEKVRDREKDRKEGDKKPTVRTDKDKERETDRARDTVRSDRDRKKEREPDRVDRERDRHRDTDRNRERTGDARRKDSREREKLKLEGLRGEGHGTLAQPKRKRSEDGSVQERGGHRNEDAGDRDSRARSWREDHNDRNREREGYRNGGMPNGRFGGRDNGGGRGMYDGRGRFPGRGRGRGDFDNRRDNGGGRHFNNVNRDRQNQGPPDRQQQAEGVVPMDVDIYRSSVDEQRLPEPPTRPPPPPPVASSNSKEDIPIDVPAEQEEDDPGIEPPPKEAANFGLSGALAKDTGTGNIYKGVVLKWTEPPEARVPTKKWRLYVFKGPEIVQTLHIHRQSAYLIGRERKIADMPIDHPSCSKQHAVLQFRLKEEVREAAMTVVRNVRPYIMDLESTNGTWLNGVKIEPSRYIELVESDCLKFGNSSREYVLLHDKSKAAA